MKVAVVVDSSAGLPPEVATGQRVTVVPLSVAMDGPAIPETQVPTADVLARIAAGRSVRVVSPGVGAFVDCYRALGDLGYDEVVSIHLPASMSPVVRQAHAAAERMRAEDGVGVHVVDGQVSAMGLGWVALTSAGAAASGMTGAEVRDLAVVTAARTLGIYAAGDMAHLQRAGRMGARRSVMGAAVGVHPVFRVQRGQTHPAGTPLNLGRAIDRIVELADDNGRGWPLHLTVQHAGAPEAAESLRERVLGTGLRIRGDVNIVPVGPVVATFVGPRTVGLVSSPTEWLTHDDRWSTAAP